MKCETAELHLIIIDTEKTHIISHEKLPLEVISRPTFDHQHHFQSLYRLIDNILW